jgi:serine/threonine-protein kinase RsbW
MSNFEAQVRARADEISALTERAGDFLESAGVDGRAAHHVAMILEELLTNLGTHGGMQDEPATIRISIESNRILAEITDTGPPFDPRSMPDPDLSSPVEERNVGGLGLFLMRKLASDIDYVRNAGCNRTSFAVARK